VVSYLNRLKGPRNWSEWLAAEAPFRAVYRESRDALVARPDGEVDADNPAPVEPGMITATVDGNGRLLRFSAVPAEAAPLTPPVDPAVVFRAARLEPSAFQEVPPTLVPGHASDAIRAWKGRHPHLPNTEVTLEMALWKGRVTEARLLYGNMETAGAAAGGTWQHAQQILTVVLGAIGGLLIVLMARRNWKAARSDRSGALRIAAARFLVGLAAWAGFVHPVPSDKMATLFLNAASDLLGTAAILWLLYLAIEPAVRARYPHAMVTWNRLLAGRWLDAQVGAHVLMGAALGCAIWVGFTAADFSRNAGTLGSGGNLRYLLGTRAWVGAHANTLASAMGVGPVVFAVICGIRRLVRLDLLAALATAVVFTFTLQGDVYSAHGADLAILVGLYLGVYTVVSYVLMRLGLVATIALIYFVNSFSGLWLGNDWTTWYASSGIATAALMIGIAVFAFWRSLGGRELLGGEDPAA
jgi:serine/threonine-protein kinase